MDRHRIKEARAANRSTQIRDTEGYVYVLWNPAWPAWVKIGRADLAEKRAASYQTGSPFRDYEVVASRRTLDRVVLEKLAHDAVKREGYEQRGEWFEIDKAHAAYLLFNLRDPNMGGVHVQTDPE
jgi:hypothetical protein